MAAWSADKISPQAMHMKKFHRQLHASNLPSNLKSGNFDISLPTAPNLWSTLSSSSCKFLFKSGVASTSLPPAALRKEEKKNDRWLERWGQCNYLLKYVGPASVIWHVNIIHKNYAFMWTDGYYLSKLVSETCCLWNQLLSHHTCKMCRRSICNIVAWSSGHLSWLAITTQCYVTQPLDLLPNGHQFLGWKY